MENKRSTLSELAVSDDHLDPFGWVLIMEVTPPPRESDEYPYWAIAMVTGAYVYQITSLRLDGEYAIVNGGLRIPADHPVFRFVKPR